MKNPLKINYDCKNMSKYYFNNCSTIIDFCFFNLLIKFYTKKSKKIITNKSNLNLISKQKNRFLR